MSMSRVAGRFAVIGWALLTLTIARPLRGEELEPPSDEPEGVDVLAATDDSLPDGEVELGVGADGTGSGSHRRRRVRFNDPSLRGDWRSGDDDPLSGGAIEASTHAGVFSVGRVSPRWGRGLVMGRADDPWHAALAGRDAWSVPELAPPRTRTVDGAGFRRAGRVTLDGFAGRLARERIGALHVAFGVMSLGMVQRVHGRAIGSMAVAGTGQAIELAATADGQWRAEAIESGGGATLAWRARARAGSVGFRPPGPATGPGPPHAMALELAGSLGRWRAHALGALWRWHPGLAGARGALDVGREMPHHASFSLGVEEQHGARRSTTASERALRQGAWGEVRLGDGPVRIGVRDEVWGSQPFARTAVRSVSAVWMSLVTRGNLSLTLARSEYRVSRGESLYLPEAGSERLWLRAVSGAGAHTRIEGELPLLGGRVRATLARIESTGRTVRPHWSVDWTRRARTRRDDDRGGP